MPNGHQNESALSSNLNAPRNARTKKRQNTGSRGKTAPRVAGKDQQRVRKRSTGQNQVNPRDNLNSENSGQGSTKRRRALENPEGVQDQGELYFAPESISHTNSSSDSPRRRRGTGEEADEALVQRTHSDEDFEPYDPFDHPAFHQGEVYADEEEREEGEEDAEQAEDEIAARPAGCRVPSESRTPSAAVARTPHTTDGNRDTAHSSRLPRPATAEPVTEYEVEVDYDEDGVFDEVPQVDEEEREERVDYREQAQNEEVHEEVPPSRSPPARHTTQRRVHTDEDLMERPTSSRGNPSRATDHENRYSSSNASSNRPREQFGGSQSAGGPVLADRWQQSRVDDNASIIRSSVDPDRGYNEWEDPDIIEPTAERMQEIEAQGVRAYSIADRLGSTADNNYEEGRLESEGRIVRDAQSARMVALEKDCRRLMNEYAKMRDFAYFPKPTTYTGIVPWESAYKGPKDPTDELECDAFHNQVTPGATRDLVDYLITSRGYSDVILDSAPSVWETHILGVINFMGNATYPWALFRDLYPYDFDVKVLRFTLLPRSADRYNAADAVIREWHWIFGGHSLGIIQSMCIKRLNYLHNKTTAGDVQAAIREKNNISRQSAQARQQQRQTRTPREQEYGYDEGYGDNFDPTPAYPRRDTATSSNYTGPLPGEEFYDGRDTGNMGPPLPRATPGGATTSSGSQGQQYRKAAVLTTAPVFPREYEVQIPLLANFLELKERVKAHRKRGGDESRDHFFSDVAWEQVEAMIPASDRARSRSWDDAEWFAYIERIMRGRKKAVVAQADGLERVPVIMGHFRRHVKPTYRCEAKLDSQLLLDTGLRKALEAMTNAGLATTCAKAEYQVLLKEIHKHLTTSGGYIQLPAYWEGLCNKVMGYMKNETMNPRRDLALYKTFFLEEFKADTAQMAYLEEHFSIHLPSLRARDLEGGNGPKATQASGSGGTNQSNNPTPRNPPQVTNNLNQPEPRADEKLHCYGCGKLNHRRQHCELYKHPFFNKESKPWGESTNGGLYQAQRRDFLPKEFDRTPEWYAMRFRERQPQGTSQGSSSSSSSSSSNPGHGSSSSGTKPQGGYNPNRGGSTRPQGGNNTPNKANQGGGNTHYQPYSGKAVQFNDALVALEPVNIVGNEYDELDFLIPCHLSISRGTEEGRQVKVHALLDTGGKTDKDLVSVQALKLLGIDENSPGCSSCDVSICSSINMNTCRKCLGLCNLNVILIHNDINKTNFMLSNIPSYIIEMRYDIIIGLKTILKYNLLPILNSFFQNQYTFSVGAGASSLLVQGTVQPRDISSLEVTTTNSQVGYRLPKEHFFGATEWDYDGTEDLVTISDLLPNIDATDGGNQSALDCVPRLMEDTPFHRSIQALCLEFRDIFSRTVMPTAAAVPPFKLEVDDQLWHVKAHCKGARPQPPVRRAEIKKQVEMMLDLGVVRRAHNVGHYSQVLLTPKPGGKWRFCIDYRILNAVSRNNAGFPIPNIPSMLHRLGAKKFKYAGKLDFSSGYHQVLMDPTTSQMAAFICEEGVFVPNRLMFGIMAAPSYYQGHMAKTVLDELLHQICELYIDDIFMWGQTEDEFLANLRQIFQRLREKNITVNPDKCELGVPRLEFVGHVIDQDGIGMSEDKTDKVLDFPLPENVKQLRSFLGLCNYFSDHIRDSSNILRPLHKMVARHTAGLTKRKASAASLEWVPDEIEAFHAIKNAMARCPKLFFVNETSEIYLLTDASDFGIGAYLYQLIDGHECPIRFMSHTLTDVQLRWSTVEKECYAIFRAIQDMNYLLCDRKFHLLTDHRNLTFLADPQGNKGTSQKVVRWRLAIQELDFDITHIEGAKNIAADAFSRLVLQPKMTLPHVEHTVDVLDMKSKSLNAKVHELISQFHNPLVGHMGEDRTVKSISDAGHKWRGLRRDVKLFIQQCPLCQKLSQVKPVVVAQPIHIGGEFRPMSRLCVDSLDVVETTDGYKYTLAVMDSFTRWIELYPLKSLDASEAAECLIDWFGRYGFATELLSDNGPQFVNELIGAVLKLVGTKHVLTLAYSKEENGRIERANKEILRHLRQFIGDSRVVDDWVVKLPFVQRIMNAHVHSLTGFTPAEMLYGKAIELNRNIFPIATTEKASSVLSSLDIDSKFFKDWIENRNEAQQEVLRASSDLQTKLREEHLASLPKEKVTAFEIGSWVLIQPHMNPLTGRRATGDKLTPYWAGPYQVQSQTDANTYVLRDTVQDKTFNRHVKDLHRFNYDPQFTDPSAVALIDRREFVIEKVLDHRGEVTSKKSLEFLVKWKGYTDDFNLWLPWKEVMYVTALHEYLTSKNLAKLIPGRPQVSKKQRKT